MSAQLKKRPIAAELKFLADYELYGALLFTALYFAVKYIVDMDFGNRPFRLRWVSFCPLLLFSAIVVEGSFYWRNKRNRLLRKQALSRVQIGGIYHKLRWINAAFLTAYPAAILIAALARGTLPGLLPGMVFYLMALIEQVNYFHIRLSYEMVNGGLLIVRPLRELLTGTGRPSAPRKDIDAYLHTRGQKPTQASME